MAAVTLMDLVQAAEARAEDWGEYRIKLPDGRYVVRVDFDEEAGELRLWTNPNPTTTE